MIAPLILLYPDEAQVFGAAIRPYFPQLVHPPEQLAFLLARRQLAFSPEEASALLQGLKAVSLFQMRKAGPHRPRIRDAIRDHRLRYSPRDPDEHWLTYREVAALLPAAGAVGAAPVEADCEDLATMYAAEMEADGWDPEAVPVVYSSSPTISHVVVKAPRRGVFIDPSRMAGMGSETARPMFSAMAGLFAGGLPAEAYQPGRIGAELVALTPIEGLGADLPLALPPAPNWSSSTAVRAYLAEAWRRVGRHHKAPDQAIEAVYRRLTGLRVASSPQRMVSDVIMAGPGLTTPGATAFYRIAQLAQGEIERRTREPSIGAVAGLVAAEAARQVGEAVSSALAAPGKVAGKARDVGASVVKSATDQARAVVALPGQIVEDITSVPKHLVSEVGTTAREYIAAVKEVAPDLAKAASDSAGRFAFGASSGLAVVGVVTAGVLAAVTFGPDLVAAKLASRAAAGARR